MKIYGDLVYRLKKIRGMTDFSDQFRKNIMRFMKNLSSYNQADVIKAFNLTSRYLDDLLNIDILILKEWSTKFIHLNCNLIKLILQIPRPPFWIGFTSVYF